MGVVLTQLLSSPRNFRAILLALLQNSSLLVCLEVGKAGSGVNLEEGT